MLPHVVLFRSEDKPFDDALRAEVFAHYRGDAAPGVSKYASLVHFVAPASTIARTHETMVNVGIGCAVGLPAVAGLAHAD